MTYIFGGDTGLTYDQVQQRRKIAEQMRGSIGAPKNVGEGIQAIAKALVARGADRQASQADQRLSSEADSLYGSILSGGNPAPMGQREAMAAYGGPTSDAASAVNAGEIRQGLIDRGLPAHIADGFVMNFQDESGLNPGINEIAPTVPGSRGGFGLAQWTGPRRRELEAFAQSQGKPVSDTDLQLDFLMSELQGSERGAAKAILASQDAPSAAAAIVNHFLRPAEQHRARRVAEYTGGGGGGGPNASIQQIAQALGNPYIQRDPARVAVLEALMQRQMQASDPMRQLQMQKMQMELSQMQNPQITPYQQAQLDLQRQKLEAPDLTADQKDYQFYTQQEQAAGREPLSFNEWNLQSRRAGATNVTVGGAGPELGKLSTDYGYVLDPETGQPKVDPQTGLPTAAPVPGSPAAQDLQAAAAAKSELEAQTSRAANIVMQDIDLALEQSGGFGTTGVIGSVASNIGGTEAHDLENTLRTIQANIGFDRLQQMREASPTGGALGAVSERELTELQAVLGSIKQSQSKDQLQRNLNRLKGVYGAILAKANAYPNADQFGFGGAVEGASDVSGAAPAAPAMTQESFMSDPGVIEAARSAGVTPQEMWEIYQEGRQ
jgi:hypothetical protein